MHMKVIIVTAIILGIYCASCTDFAAAFPQPERQGDTIDLKDCPAFDKPFKVAPYVVAAAKLQTLGKEKACKKMAELAQRDDEGQVAILCRMLFRKKASVSFRP